MLHRWNLLNRANKIKNCFEKINGCHAIQWNDYGYIDTNKISTFESLVRKTRVEKSSENTNHDHHDQHDQHDQHDIGIRASMMI